jgi:hypothetical protein
MPELPKSRKFTGKICPDIAEQSRSPYFYVSFVFSKKMFFAQAFRHPYVNKKFNDQT